MMFAILDRSCAMFSWNWGDWAGLRYVLYLLCIPRLKWKIGTTKGK